METEGLRRLVSLTAAPTVTASAYAAGDCVGTLITLAGAVRASGMGAVLRKVTVSFKALNQPTLDILLFDAEPTGTTFTDKSAVAVVVADLPKIVGALSLSDYTLSAASTMAFGQAIVEVPFLPAAAATTIYAQVVARSAFTPTGTADFGIKFLIQQST